MEELIQVFYRPPMYNRKMPDEIRELHNQSRVELDNLIDMLNKDLDLCLVL
jgi:hypothetical protein